ncbi:MAG: hypothetical protein M3R00_09730, partial [Pseudomonadota bacterium]|nr:hypothetical protein [Pseudomonadota bacterium]
MLIDTLIATLDTKPEPNKQPLVIRLSEAEIVRVMAVLKSDDTLINLNDQLKRVALYLNMLIVNLRTNGSDVGYEVTRIAFLGIKPVRLCCLEECSNQEVGQLLETLRKQLHIQSEQLLNGWRIEPNGALKHVVNYTNGINWVLFCGLYKKTPEDLSEATKLSFSDIIFKHRFNLITAKVPCLGFLALSTHYGFCIPYYKQFKEAIATLAEQHPHCKEELLAMTQTSNSSELMQNIENFIENKKPSFSAELLAIHENYSFTETLVKDLAIKPTQVHQLLQEANEALHFIQKPKPEIKSLADESTHFASDIIEHMTALAWAHFHLKETLPSLTALSTPYDVKLEQLYCNSIINMTSYIQPLASIRQFICQTSLTEKEAEAMTKWLIITYSKALGTSLKTLSEKKYHYTTIVICEALIDISTKLTSIVGNQIKLNLLGLQMDLRRVFFAACINGCYFEKLLYWLNQFEKYPNILHTDKLYSFFFDKGDILHTRALIALKTDNVSRSLEIFNESTQFLEKIIKQFAEMGRPE